MRDIRLLQNLIILHSGIVSDTVPVGSRPPFPTSIILGNDLAGEKVLCDLQVSHAPCLTAQRESIESLCPS